MPDSNEQTTELRRGRGGGIDRRRFLAGAGATGATALAGCTGIFGGGGGGPIRIGAVYLLSGIAEVLGAGSVAAAEVAVDQMNENEGILGRDVEILSRDHGSNPQQQIRSLVQEESVDAMLGLTSSGVTLNSAPTIESLGVPFTLTDIGTPYITEHDVDTYGDYYDSADGRAAGIPNLFRTNSNTSINTHAMATWASENFDSGTRIAYMGPDYAYGEQVWEYFKAYADGLGAGFEYVGAEFPSLGANDMTPQINSITNADPDVVVTSFWAADVVTFVSQAADQGLFDQVETTMSSIGASPSNFKALGDTMPEGQHWIGWYWYTAYDNPVNDEFVSAYKEANQGGDLPSVPEFTGGPSYTAPLIYKQAMEAAGGTTPEDVIAEMEGLTIDSPMGEITLDPDSHQATSPTCLGTTSMDTDVPYEGVGLTDVQTYTLDRQTATDLLEGTKLPPGV